jgi:hypothetical protein
LNKSRIGQGPPQNIMAALVCINSKRFYSTTIKLSVKTKTYFLYGRQNDMFLAGREVD